MSGTFGRALICRRCSCIIEAEGSMPIAFGAMAYCSKCQGIRACDWTWASTPNLEVEEEAPPSSCVRAKRRIVKVKAKVSIFDYYDRHDVTHHRNHRHD